MKALSSIIAWSVSGALCMLFLNFFIIDPILIPDPCAYHGRETGRVFNLFYEMPADDGYHPTPTAFNTGFTLSTGAGFSNMFRKLFLNW